MPDLIGHPFRHSTACPWNLSSGTPEAFLLLLQCRLESAETERHRGLDEPTSPFTSQRLVTSADNARHAASRHRPLHVAPAHFRFRTRACTAAATRYLRTCSQFHFRCRRGFPPVAGVGWLRKARENVPSLPYAEEGGHLSPVIPRIPSSVIPRCVILKSVYPKGV